MLRSLWLNVLFIIVLSSHERTDLRFSHFSSKSIVINWMSTQFDESVCSIEVPVWHKTSLLLLSAMRRLIPLLTSKVLPMFRSELTFCSDMDMHMSLAFLNTYSTCLRWSSNCWGFSGGFLTGELRDHILCWLREIRVLMQQRPIIPNVSDSKLSVCHTPNLSKPVKNRNFVVWFRWTVCDDDMKWDTYCNTNYEKVN